jgi:hypothetical protein
MNRDYRKFWQGISLPYRERSLQGVQVSMRSTVVISRERSPEKSRLVP